MMRRWLHAAVLGTRQTPGLRALYRGIYRGAAASAARSFSAVPGVESVLLHRGMTGPAWEPGVSDIDLILVLRSPPRGETELLRGLQRRLLALRRAFPMLGDLWIGDAGELGAYLRWGGLRAWEDSPRWRALQGPAPRPAENSESPLKRTRLDPWAWAFVSAMELGRRFFLPFPGPPEKARAERVKLFADSRRFAQAAASGAPPAAREDFLRGGAARADARGLWLEAALDLDRCSRAVLTAAATGTAALNLPPPRAASRPRLERLLADSGALAVIEDPPYHSYLLLPDGARPGDFARAADSLAGRAWTTVPVILGPAAWALLLQSSYLGAPLGWLGWDGDIPRSSSRFAGGETGAVGSPPRSLPILSASLRREVAAESLSWMSLWWRSLWIDPAYPNRFALFHLYTRAMALRLELFGEPSGPYNDAERLIASSRERFPQEAPFLESLAEFLREEPLECFDALPRPSLAAEHAEALARMIGAAAETLDPGRTCSVR